MSPINWGVAALLGAAALAAGCRGPKTSTADVDIAGLRAQFACKGSGEGVAKPCQLLSDFAGAGSVEQWPTTGTDAWAGYKFCQQTDADSVRFANLHVRSLSGQERTATNNLVPPDRLLPIAIENPQLGVRRATLDEWEPLLAAVKEGRQPDLSKPYASANWQTLLKPASASFHPAIRTDGPSATFSESPAYLRAAGSRWILVEPHFVGGAYHNPCVSELWRVPASK